MKTGLLNLKEKTVTVKLESLPSIAIDKDKLSKPFGSIMLTIFVYLFYAVWNFLHESIVSRTVKPCIVTVSLVKSFHATIIFIYPLETS